MLQPSITPRRAVGVGGTSIVDLRTVIRAKDVEIGRLKLALAASERETAEWRRRCQLAYSNDGCASFADIVGAVCAEFGVSKTDILSDRRSQYIALPRHVAMYLCSTITRRSYTVIGRYFRRDSTTVLDDCRKIAAKVKNDLQFAARVRAVSAQAEGR